LWRKAINSQSRYVTGPFVVKFADFTITKLVDHNNEFHDQVRIGEAKNMAQEAGLDLVCFNKPDKNSSALCKIIDYGKWKYSEEKKKKKNKEGKKSTKEIRLSPVISDHDVEHKLKQAKEFLEDGDDVVLAMRIKGRQRAHLDVAELRMNEIIAKCSEYGTEVQRKKNSGLITVRIIKGKPKEEVGDE